VIDAEERVADVVLQDCDAGSSLPTLRFRRDAPASLAELSPVRTTSDLMVELGRRGIAACLARGSESLGRSLLTAGLVDKIIAGPNLPAPAGFRRRVDHLTPAPHVALYPGA
jgi:hypothetical protein